MKDTIEALPKELSKRLTEIDHRLTSKEGPEGRIAASIEAMEEDEVETTAESLVDIAFFVWQLTPEKYTE